MASTITGWLSILSTIGISALRREPDVNGVCAGDTQEAIAHFPLRAGADVVKFDSGTGRIYAACSSGFIAVFQERDADHFEKIEDFPVQKLVLLC
jgi:hypothetical protein